MAGAPTLYKPEYCQKVIEFGKLGLSITEMACELDVVKQTMYDWEKVHPEFLDAMTRARQESQAWYEKQGRSGIWAGSNFNAATWAKQVSCRFPDDYREKQDVNLGGQKDNPIKTDIDNDALNARILELANKARALGTSGAAGETEAESNKE